MSILSVDTIQPIGSGSTVTLNAAKIVVGTGITFESNGQAIYAGIITATSFSGSGANLTSLPAANLTGTLPAISGANLTSLPAANLTGTLPAISGEGLTRTTQLSHRNLIINGAMRISQRATSSSTVGAGSGYSVMDRFKTNNDLPSGVSNLTLSQDSDAPTGFSKSYKVTPNQAGTLADSDRFFLQTSLEAQDIKSSGWNYTDSNSKLTLSFYIKSNLTGIVSLEMNSPDSPSTKRHFRSTVTINSANTWERKTVTITGDSQLVFDDNNEAGLSITWHYASGPNFSNGTHVTGSWDTTAVAGNRSSSSNINIYSNTSNFVSLTGVQLEVGEQATPFEHRSFAEELNRCERYYQNSFIEGNIPGTSTAMGDAVITTSWSDGNAPGPNPFRTAMRIAPSVTLRARGSTTTGQVNHNGSNVSASAQQIGSKGIAYIETGAGASANAFNAFTFELDAEL